MLTRLTALDLQHKGRGMSTLPDLSPLAALTGLLSLRLRYGAVRHSALLLVLSYHIV